MPRVRVGAVDLAYYTRGAGFPVFLITGLGGSARQWGEKVPDALAARFQVITLDNRGTGDSDKPDEPYSLEQMADEVVAVLDATGAARAHFVGSSMGGMIAQLVALRHSERVERLVLVSTTPGGPHTVAPQAEALGALAPDLSRPRDAIVRSAMSAISAPGFAAAHPEVIEEIVRVALDRPTAEHAFARQLAAVLDSDRYDRLPEIRKPVLIVHGDADPLVPCANGRILAERIPGARLMTLRGCGHLPMWEKPAELAAVLLEFLGAP